MADLYSAIEKEKNDFVSGSKEGIDTVCQLCENFEYDLNIISYSFINSISRLSTLFKYQVKEQELKNIFRSFDSFLTVLENDFNSQLEQIIKEFHSIKFEYAKSIESNLEIFKEGINQALIWQMKSKVNQNHAKNSANCIAICKCNVQSFREQLNDLREEIIHIQNSFSYKMTNYKQKKAKLIKSIGYESNEYIEKRRILEEKINKEKLQNFKANINDNNNYYLLINNIENNTDPIKSKFEKEIHELKNKNSIEKQKFIDSFNDIHDKICKNMDKMSKLRKVLEKLKLSNKEKEAETRSLFKSEEENLRLKNQKFSEAIKEIQVVINEVLRENEIEYINEREKSNKRIEIEKQNEEIEFKHLMKKLKEKHQRELDYIISLHPELVAQRNMELDYQAKYNEYVKQLESPVFSKAIGYEKSQDITELIAQRDLIINKISNQRSYMISKSKSENFYEDSFERNSNAKSRKINQICHNEKYLLKKIWEIKIDSANKIRQKEKEVRIETRRIRKKLNSIKRIILTRKLYLIDEFDHFNISNLKNKLKNDEKNDNYIESLEDKILFYMNQSCEMNNNLNLKKIKELENKFDELDNSYYQITEDLIWYKEQAQNRKKEFKINHCILRSKQTQQHNLISPASPKTLIKPKKKTSKY